ncbi:MAG TPA: hypothetical protein VK919_10480 [Solirubrobacterales bacterium]|nr:hypothetical protein [Solirubrobacterales bacterium]
MRQGTARGLAIAIAGAALVAVALAPAEAAKPRIATTVTIKNEFDPAHAEPIRFYGKVRSSKPACKRGREIELHARAGGELPAEPRPPETTRSDKRGRWEVRLLADGLPRYVVKVKPKKKPRFTCKRARAVYQFVN